MTHDLDALQGIFEAQRKLQTMLLGIDPQQMGRGDMLRYITTMVTACTDELHEALNETGWKPWATSDHINDEAFKDELVDGFLFWVNLALVRGMTAKELYNRYHEKRANAEERFRNKYDGVSTKCPVCKRAYDNKAVDCYPAIEAIPDNGDGKSRPASPAWCGRQAMMEATVPPTEPHCPRCRTVYGPDVPCHPATPAGFGWCDRWKESLIWFDNGSVPLGGERIA